MNPATGPSPADPETILVAVAWPYANGDLHLGQTAGAYLPADIYARYNRMKGNRTLMVSGSDSHGTPVTVRAEAEGVTPEEIFQRYHRSFLDTFERFGITFDLFTHTDTANHIAVTQDIFTTLLRHGHLYEAEQTLLYDPEAERFLPDRYVEGTCPHCSFTRARGDQCDNCGRTVDALELIDPRSKITSARPEPRTTRHHFLRLSAFTDELLEWATEQHHWRPSVRNFVLGMLREGLHDRAITRDITWGIPIPLEGYETKRIYVWFEAVIGYLSAAKEWALIQGEPEIWRDWWEDPSARTVYFQGKDNVPFHAIIWPAMLLGYEGLNLPYDVPANQYVTIGGSKASTSGNWAVWMPDYLDRHDPDPLRYVLTALMPETRDTDFSWKQYVRRNNDELLARWGQPRQSCSDHHQAPLRRRRAARARGALRGVTGAARCALTAPSTRSGQTSRPSSFAVPSPVRWGSRMTANQYLEERAPWRAVRDDRDHAAETLHTALNVISGLASLFQPFLPFTSPRAWAMLGHSGDIQAAGWLRRPVPGGQPLPEPAPLFRKLDDSLIAEEEARFG